MKGLHSESTDRLFEVLLGLKDIDECYDFFEDLCTVKEIKDMSQRLEVAMLLNRNLSYQEVASRTGVSTATIGRVKRCLEYGAGGYAAAISRIEEAENG